MFRELRASLTLFVILMVITGFGYPILVLKAGQTLFPEQANGSLVNDNGKIIGSTLIGQNFTNSNYFHPRPSAAGKGYDAAASSASNLAPTSADLITAVTTRITALKTGGATSLAIPADLVTSSASGLDPDISVASARFQAGHVAEARHIDIDKIEPLIDSHTTPRSLGFIGENRVNVLDLNRALDQLAPLPASSP